MPGLADDRFDPVLTREAGRTGREGRRRARGGGRGARSSDPSRPRRGRRTPRAPADMKARRPGHAATGAEGQHAGGSRAPRTASPPAPPRTPACTEPRRGVAPDGAGGRPQDAAVRGAVADGCPARGIPASGAPGCRGPGAGEPGHASVRAAETVISEGGADGAPSCIGEGAQAGCSHPFVRRIRRGRAASAPPVSPAGLGPCNAPSGGARRSPQPSPRRLRRPGPRSFRQGASVAPPLPARAEGVRRAMPPGAREAGAGHDDVGPAERLARATHRPAVWRGRAGKSGRGRSIRPSAGLRSLPVLTPRHAP